MKSKMVNHFKRMQSILRKRRKRKIKVKIRHINQRKGVIDKINSKKRNRLIRKTDNVTISGGDSFSLIEEPENVINVLLSLERTKRKNNLFRNIKIDLADIRIIDIAAISLLLAKVNEMIKNNRLRLWGTMPKDNDCMKIFHESGFLDYMTDLSGNKFNTKKSQNFIFKVGSDKTRNEKVGKTIEKSMRFLTGKEEKYPPVYSIVQEICSNSVEWANPHTNKNKNWFLGINFNKGLFNSSITFLMTDIGQGILNTINRKHSTLIKETLMITKDTEILKRAFERKYGSKTKESNRNRGLPLIKDRFEKKLIKNLLVITNNVFLDFADEKKTKLLSQSMPGTFYCWEIDLNCIEKWKENQLL